MAGLDAHLQASRRAQRRLATALLPAENDVLGNRTPTRSSISRSASGEESWAPSCSSTMCSMSARACTATPECDVTICSNPAGGIVYGVTTRPRMIGLKFTQKF